MKRQPGVRADVIHRDENLSDLCQPCHSVAPPVYNERDIEKWHDFVSNFGSMEAAVYAAASVAYPALQEFVSEMRERELRMLRGMLTKKKSLKHKWPTLEEYEAAAKSMPVKELIDGMHRVDRSSLANHPIVVLNEIDEGLEESRKLRMSLESC